MRALIKLTIGLLLIFVILSALTLLFFNLSPGKSLISDVVKNKSGLEFTYGSLIPTSLDTVKVSEIEVSPNAILKLSELNVNLNLRESVKTRRPKFDIINIINPQVSVKEETLVTLIKTALKKTPSIKSPTNIPKPQPKKPSTEETKKTPLTPPVKPNLPKKQPPPRKKTKRPPFPEISITDGEFHITSQRFQENMLSLKGLSLKTNENEQHRTATLKLETANILGKQLELDIQQPVEVKNRQLYFPVAKHKIENIAVSTTGGVVASPILPFHGQVAVEIQEPTTFSHPLLPQAVATLGSSKAVFKTSGALASPSSINAILNTISDSINLSFSGKGEQLFQSHRAEISLKRGQLTIPQFSFKSEDLSLMGNGVISSSRKGRAVIRMVGSPMWKEKYSLLTNGLRLSAASKKMDELDTPDRYMKDFYLRLRPEQVVEYKFSGEEEWTSLDLLLNRIRSFVKQEVNEE